MAKQTNGGQYNRQLTWQVRSYTTDANSGARIPSWTGNTILWGSVAESAGSYADQFGTTRSRTEAVITLRQFPNVSSQDRLVDVLFGHTYIVDSVELDWPNNQTVCNCFRLQNDPL